MRLTVYHGTTAADMPAIRRSGLRKGTWCSPERAVAERFARSRAAHLGSIAVVLTVVAKVTAIRNDRAGRPECQLKAATRPAAESPA